MDLISREELIKKLAIIESIVSTQKINSKLITEAITSCRIYNMQKLTADIHTDAQLYRELRAQRAIQSMLADKIGAGLFEGGAVKLFEEFLPATNQVRAQARVAVIIPEDKDKEEKAAASLIEIIRCLERSLQAALDANKNQAETIERILWLREEK